MTSPPISASASHGLQSLTPPSANKIPRQGRQSIEKSASTLEISVSKSDSGSTFSLSIKSSSTKLQYDCDSQPSTPDISPTRRLAPGRPGPISTGAGLLMEQLTGRLRSLGIRGTEQHGVEGSDLLPIEWTKPARSRQPSRPPTNWNSSH
ncbi:hypothetical protein BDV19DRAFT_212999 [Aspergillus venezuelensis]